MHAHCQLMKMLDLKELHLTLLSPLSPSKSSFISVSDYEDEDEDKDDEDWDVGCVYKCEAFMSFPQRHRAKAR